MVDALPQEPAPNEPEQPATAAPENALPPLEGTPEQISPIRPNNPTAHTGSAPRLLPTRPGSRQPPNIQVSTVNQGASGGSQSPSKALAYLRHRMTEVSEEFATGLLNRAQFHAIYNRYSEQRSVIEKILEHDPDSEAWQQVARPGHTSFLRQHFAARVIFFALFPLGKLTPIIRYGHQLPPPQAILPVLKALPHLLAEHGSLPPASKALKNGRWLVVVPGQITVSLASCSLEPAAQQIQKIADLHRDFEQANRYALARQDYAQTKLVFPQRALFEEDAKRLY